MKTMTFNWLKDGRLRWRLYVMDHRLKQVEAQLALHDQEDSRTARLDLLGQQLEEKSEEWVRLEVAG